jgi:hypothetical protein
MKTVLFTLQTLGIVALIVVTAILQLNSIEATASRYTKTGTMVTAIEMNAVVINSNTPTGTQHLWDH